MPLQESLNIDQRPSNQNLIENDFSITVATVNGSGSQTSNMTLMRALFRMGIPVSGKNIFPSNIQGLPTWYTIRVSEAGFLARREEHEIVVAMNPATFAQDMADVVPGGAFFYDDSIRLPVTRDDIAIYPMPAKALVQGAGVPSNLRDYVANMVYVGVLAQILGISMENIYQALEFHFKGKQKPIDMNWGVVKASAEWAASNLTKSDPYMVRPSNKTDGYIMADGNTAAALGALYGGAHLLAWYPITPASSLAEAFNEYAPMFRKDPITGKNTFASIQAEDELAAVGMLVGAGWAGLRALTSTSGPGMSLMTEYVGLAYFAEVPIVIWNVQRVGPSTGLPTRTSQGDLMQAYYLGHGDTRHVVLLPGSVTECFEFGWRAFDLAERLQTPVLVLSDLDFGMNQWMTRPFSYPDAPIDRGKVLWEEDLEQMGSSEWGRYLDVDGDGIPYRTVPGNKHPRAAYFARGTGHTAYARYSEEPDVWEENLLRIQKKIENSREILPEPISEINQDADIGLIAYGSTEPAVREAVFYLEKRGIRVDFLRLRALPASERVASFIKGHAHTFVVELNRDGQLKQILTLEFSELATKLRSLAHLDGLPLTAKWIVDALMAEKES